MAANVREVDVKGRDEDVVDRADVLVKVVPDAVAVVVVAVSEASSFSSLFWDLMDSVRVFLSISLFFMPISSWAKSDMPY